MSSRGLHTSERARERRERGGWGGLGGGMKEPARERERRGTRTWTWRRTEELGSDERLAACPPHRASERERESKREQIRVPKRTQLNLRNVVATDTNCHPLPHIDTD